MKVHFIYPNVDCFRYPGVHHGLASISSVLGAGGHAVSLHYVVKRPSKRDILGVIEREAPDLIGFSSTTNQIQFVDLWSRWIKEESNTPTICGGVHATLMPEEVLAFEGIDMICRGEGEYPMLELAEDSGPFGIRNLWTKRDGVIVRNELRPLIDPLDDLPWPDYDLFNCERILSERGDFALLASRGCPFNCAHCCNHALKEVLGARYFRLRSVDNVLAQIELLTSKYDIGRITFADDTFGLSKEWALEFCERYRDRFSMEFECNARADLVDEELVKNLKAANCTLISLGVESGDERIRKEVLNRKMSDQQIVNAFDLVHSYGIKTNAFNMIGLPYETRESVQRTIDLNKRLKPDHVTVSFFYPYPQTRLWDVCKNEGFLTVRSATDHVRQSTIDLPTITRKELERLWTEFYRFAIEREAHAFPVFLRPPLRTMSFVLSRLFGKRGIEFMMALQLRYGKLLRRRRGRSGATQRT